jgi:Periplasmic copper-binding protein (NosD)
VNQGNSAVPRVRIHLVAVATLVCALIALALPALASAQTFEVDSNGDEAKTAVGAVCDTGAPAAEHCSLRAAIEAGNEDATTDVIEFEPAKFQGVGGNGTVTLTEGLPAITEPVEILGGRCHTAFEFGFEGPCAEIAGLTAASAGEDVFTVEAEDATIQGLSIVGGKDGIAVVDGAKNFVATGNWVGLKLDGSGGENYRAGIMIEPGSERTLVGGVVETDRNVFGHGTVGVYVYGSSHNAVQGNYIGVRPNGTYTSGTALESAGVRIVDDTSTVPAARAEDNEVGGVLGDAEAASKKCDGACNVITSRQARAVDLSGLSTSEHASPAAGPTTIIGNYIGLQADGSAPVAEAGDGVYAGQGPNSEPGPANTTIGGLDASHEGNHIAGGSYGVRAEGTEDLVVLGNQIGRNGEGVGIAGPDSVAIYIVSEAVAQPALVQGNSLFLEGAEGIESTYVGAEIVGNGIVGGSTGIVAGEEDEGVGNLISANQLSEQDRVGIEIYEESNVVIGNTISKANWAGIVLDSHSNHNRIGGDAPGEANTIVESGLRGEEEDGAITMNTRRGLRNEFAANTGAGNHGAFIKLFANPIEGEIANGIAPSTLGSVQQSSATGTGVPGATVRLFTKASAEPGELGGYLGKVVVDAGGIWKATYATQPVGTLVAATQTSNAGTPEGGTSEVSAPTAATADPVPPPEEEKRGTGSSSSPGSSSPAPAPVKPKTPTVKITKAPKRTSTATTAKFKFTATPAAGAKFECKLDGSKWAKCSSPKSYKRLKSGTHTFRVRAKGPAGTGPVTKVRFTVKP